MNSEFFKATAERAVKTIVQALLALLVANQTDLLAADWTAGVVTALTAGAVSVLTSLLSKLKGDPNSPSLVDEGKSSNSGGGFSQLG